MELKKRILSAAILIGCLGGLTAYAYQNPIYPIESESDDNEYLEAYNELLEEYGIKLTKEDLEYLASLRDNQNIMAIGSTVGHYNLVDLEGLDTLIVTAPRQRTRIAECTSFGDYYYDILTGIYASDEFTSEYEKYAISFGEFVSKWGMKPDGICFPTFGKCDASEDALKTIEELYGPNLANAIRKKGLPVPFYSAELIYDTNNYAKEYLGTPTMKP